MKKKKTKEEKFFNSEKHDDFICDFEDKWLQFASSEQKTKAFFGDIKNAKKLYEKWKDGNDIFAKEKGKYFEKKV
jgi:predicted metal-dependent hydrolase